MLIGLFLLTVYISKSNPRYIAFYYLVLSGLITSFFPQVFNPYFKPAEIDSALFALSNISARSVLFTVIVFATPRSSLKFFPIIALLNSIWVIFSPLHYGLGMATSVDAMMLAIIYPMILKWVSESEFDNDWIKDHLIKLTIIAIPIIAIFIARGSVAIGGLCVGMTILYSRRSHWRLLLIPILIFITYYFIDPRMFNESARFICWRWSMNWWNEGPLLTKLFGTGLGTFAILGPFIQILTKQLIGSWYTMMHNDWLQCLFELGYIGLSIIFFSFLYLCYKARDHRHLLASIVTFAACAVFYYPCHNLVIAAFGVALIKDNLDI